MARKPKNVDTTYLSDFFNQYEEYSEVPSWVDDIMTGCSRTGGSNESSPNALFNYFKIYSTINLVNVTSYVNRKFEAIYNRSLSERYCYLFMQRLVACLHSMTFHLDRKEVKLI